MYIYIYTYIYVYINIFYVYLSIIFIKILEKFEFVRLGRPIYVSVLFLVVLDEPFWLSFPRLLACSLSSTLSRVRTRSVDLANNTHPDWLSQALSIFNHRAHPFYPSQRHLQCKFRSHFPFFVDYAHVLYHPISAGAGRVQSFRPSQQEEHSGNMKKQEEAVGANRRCLRIFFNLRVFIKE